LITFKQFPVIGKTTSTAEFNYW